MKTYEPATLFLRKVCIFVRKDFLEHTSYRMHFFFTLAGAMSAVVTFYFLSTLIPKETAASLAGYGGRYFPFVLIGIAFSQYFDLAMNGMKRKIRESQTVGTLEALLATKTGSGTILALSTVYEYLFASFMAIVYLVIGWLLFDLPLENANWPSALMLFIFTLTSFMSFGVLSASVILVFKRGDPISYAFQGFSYLLSGVYFPVELLPPWLQRVAQAFPLTHALRGLRQSLLQGRDIANVKGELAVLLLLTILIMPLGLLVFRRALYQAKKKGTLAHF